MTLRNPLDYFASLMDAAIGTGARAAKLAAALPGVAAAEAAIGRAVHGNGPVPTDTNLEPAVLQAKAAAATDIVNVPAAPVSSVPLATPPPMVNGAPQPDTGALATTGALRAASTMITPPKTVFPLPGDPPDVPPIDPTRPVPPIYKFPAGARAPSTFAGASQTIGAGPIGGSIPAVPPHTSALVPSLGAGAQIQGELNT